MGDESRDAIKQIFKPLRTTDQNRNQAFLIKGSGLHHFFFFVFLPFSSEAAEPAAHGPDRSRHGSVKCVGHFGSAGAGGTQSGCSLEGECDGASSPLHHQHQTRLAPSPQQRGERWVETGGRREGRCRVKRWEQGAKRKRAGGHH